MGERAPYSRVYWSVVDDPKFATIFDDDHHLATWLRLLIAADAIWPASPALPLSARKLSVKALADVGIVDLVPGHKYRIHGLDAERGRRRNSATRPPTGTPSGTPDGDQLDTNRSPNGSEVHPSRARDAMLVSSIDSSRSTVEGGPGGDDPAVAFNLRTGEYPSAKMLSWLDELGEAHGEARVAKAINLTVMTGRDPVAYLKAVRDRLRAEDRDAERREVDDERKRLRDKRAPVVSDATAKLRAALVEREGARA